jgi:hypothetical protein
MGKGLLRSIYYGSSIAVAFTALSAAHLSFHFPDLAIVHAPVLLISVVWMKMNRPSCLLMKVACIPVRFIVSLSQTCWIALWRLLGNPSLGRSADVFCLRSGLEELCILEFLFYFFFQSLILACKSHVSGNDS